MALGAAAPIAPGRPSSLRDNDAVQTGSASGITRLRWLAIVLPLVFIATLNYMLHTGLSAFHDFPGVLVVLAVVAAGIAAFSYAVFGIVNRLERENARLHERVLDAAVLEERERIAHEMHDGLAQVLGYINTQTLAVRRLLDSGRDREAAVQLEAMEQAAKRVYADVREGIFSLRAPLSQSGRLADAVRSHLGNYRQMPGAPRSVEVVVEEGEMPQLRPSTEIQLMRIVQEALNNVRNHAAAASATVRLSVVRGELLLAIEDDGRGFAPERRAPTGWPHFGLQTMRERAEAIGGDFGIDSEPDRGTAVRVRVPLATANGDGE